MANVAQCLHCGDLVVWQGGFTSWRDGAVVGAWLTRDEDRPECYGRPAIPCPGNHQRAARCELCCNSDDGLINQYHETKV